MAREQVWGSREPMERGAAMATQYRCNEKKSIGKGREGRAK